MSTFEPTDAANSFDSGRGGHPLDHPVWNSLIGAHARFAQSPGPATPGALRFPQDISPFGALRPLEAGETTVPERTWADLLALIGPGADIFLAGPAWVPESRPPGWRLTLSLPGIQMVATDDVTSEPNPEAVVLGETDVDEMVDLVRRTEPGPFLTRTHQMGTYLGIRREGKLVAMAGERLHPVGWTEISAVCTDPAFRGQGLARRLIRAVAYGIRQRGETPFLHVAAGNPAIRVYQALGFQIRAYPVFFGLRTPDTANS